MSRAPAARRPVRRAPPCADGDRRVVRRGDVGVRAVSRPSPGPDPRRRRGEVAAHAAPSRNAASGSRGASRGRSRRGPAEARRAHTGRAAGPAAAAAAPPRGAARSRPSAAASRGGARVDLLGLARRREACQIVVDVRVSVIKGGPRGPRGTGAARRRHVGRVVLWRRRRVLRRGRRRLCPAPLLVVNSSAEAFKAR